MNPAKKAPDQTTYSGRFAARLRMLREKAGLSVDEAVSKIAKAGFETTRKSIYNWESGIRQPPIDALPSMASAYKLRQVRSILPQD